MRGSPAADAAPPWDYNHRVVATYSDLPAGRRRVFHLHLHGFEHEIEPSPHPPPACRQGRVQDWSEAFPAADPGTAEGRAPAASVWGRGQSAAEASWQRPVRYGLQ
jgi:hypothetical protein